MKDSIDRSIEEEIPNPDGRPSGKPSSLKELVNILKNDQQLAGLFCFNLFTHEQEHAQDSIILSPYAKKGSIITDVDVSCLRVYLARTYNISANRANLEDAITDIALMKQYHPIKDYLESLRWDGIQRLNGWLAHICGADDNAYTASVGRKLLVAAVKRIYEPGCYYAQLVVLEGRQRMFKSRLVKELGKNWYASIHLKTNDVKTVVEEMRGKWILEIEELAGFGKQDTEHMKAFVSRQHDRVRLSYARKAEDFPRQSIMIATMNPDDGENKYLVDQTGNVRYWPIKCSDEHKIKIDEFIEIRDQLFAEALALYRQGETLWLEGGEPEQLAEIEQEKRLSVDPWYPMIDKWLNDQGMLPDIEVTTEQIATDLFLIPKERINSGVTRRIGRGLAKAGWIRKRKNTGVREWYYTPPKIEPKEIQWQ